MNVSLNEFPTYLSDKFSTNQLLKTVDITQDIKNHQFHKCFNLSAVHI